MKLLWPKFDAKSRANMNFTNAGPVVKEGLQRVALVVRRLVCSDGQGFGLPSHAGVLRAAEQVAGGPFLQ